jgi:hypothetical protein
VTLSSCKVRCIFLFWLISIFGYCGRLCPKLGLGAMTHTVAWDPRDQNWIGAAGRMLWLYDLEYTRVSPYVFAG